MRWLVDVLVGLFLFGILRWVSANVCNDGPQQVCQTDRAMGSGSSQYRLYISTTGHERMMPASFEREAALKAWRLCVSFMRKGCLRGSGENASHRPMERGWRHI